MVYEKCLEENEDTLKAVRVIEIAADIYNSDLYRPVTATAIQQGSTHKLQEKHWQDVKSGKGHGKKETSKDKDDIVSELGQLIQSLSFQPGM